MPDDRARQLRKNMTDAERAIWRHLRQRQIDGHRFRRQVVIGPYIADFACLEAKLIIEIDGGQHATAVERDAARDAIFRAQGFTVLRFWNNEVLGNIAGVVSVISTTLSAQSDS